MTDESGRFVIFGIKAHRRALDWYRATRISATITLVGAVATLAYAESVATATQTPISIVDLAVLVGIVTQTVTIGFFAGAISNRLKNLESWRQEHVEWANKQTELLVRSESLSELERRVETIERRHEHEDDITRKGRT